MQDYENLGNSEEDWFCTSCLTATFPFNHFDDNTEFLLALQESSTDLCRYYEYFKDLLFNPFTFRTQVTTTNDLDPDSQFFNSKMNVSNYFSEDYFSSKYSSSIDSFSLINFSARSIPTNFDKIENYLNLIKFPVLSYWCY